MNEVRRSTERQRQVMELRRSAAAMPHRARTLYSRKSKHKGRDAAQLRGDDCLVRGAGCGRITTSPQEGT